MLYPTIIIFRALLFGNFDDLLMADFIIFVIACLALVGDQRDSKTRHINLAKNKIEKAKRSEKFFSPRKRSEATKKAKRIEQSELFFQN